MAVNNFKSLTALKRKYNVYKLPTTKIYKVMLLLADARSGMSVVYQTNNYKSRSAINLYKIVTKLLHYQVTKVRYGYKKGYVITKGAQYYGE